jgi:hypothetical protein
VVLTSSELVEIRAAQRTFEGAYIRTALGQFSFALIVLKIFTAEFYSIGALFAVYGAGVLFTSLLRRHEGAHKHCPRGLRLLTKHRKQTVLLGSRGRRAASQEVPNERQCCDGSDCPHAHGLCRPAGTHHKATHLSCKVHASERGQSLPKPHRLRLGSTYAYFPLFTSGTDMADGRCLHAQKFV